MVTFEYESFDLQLRGGAESYRLRIECLGGACVKDASRPLYGSIDVEQCRHRTSEASRKVTLTLAKRHKNRRWPALQKSR